MTCPRRPFSTAARNNGDQYPQPHVVTAPARPGRTSNKGSNTVFECASGGERSVKTLPQVNSGFTSASPSAVADSPSFNSSVMTPASDLAVRSSTTG